VDLDRKASPSQQELIRKYHRGYIPHVTILDKRGKVVYNSAGEAEESRIAGILDEAVK
jgi:hypothetical protein